jgi:hypothetical protein
VYDPEFVMGVVVVGLLLVAFILAWDSGKNDGH